jgi:hypothetical protein
VLECQLFYLQNIRWRLGDMEPLVAFILKRSLCGKQKKVILQPSDLINLYKCEPKHISESLHRILLFVQPSKARWLLYAQ